MTVKQLKEQLNQFPENFEFVVSFNSDVCSVSEEDFSTCEVDGEGVVWLDLK